MEACQGNGEEDSKQKTHAVSEMEESGEKATIQSQVGWTSYLGTCEGFLYETTFAGRVKSSL